MLAIYTLFQVVHLRHSAIKPIRTRQIRLQSIINRAKKTIKQKGKMMKIIAKLFTLCMIFLTSCATLATEQPSPTPKEVTVIPSATATLSPTHALPTATPSATLLSTPTNIPSLSFDKAREKLLDILSNNNDCRLPCLWGITIGESDYAEVREKLMPLSSIAKDAYFTTERLNSVWFSEITPDYAEDSQHLEILAVYRYDDNGIVNNLRFRVEEQMLELDKNGNWTSRTPIFDSALFGKRTEYYSLAHVLTELGMPDSVMIYISSLSGYDVVAGGLKIALLYPEQGVWVNYTMPLHIQGNLKKGCPINAHIDMAIFPSGNPDSFFSLLDLITDWDIQKKGYRQLQDITSMSVEEFYQTFRAPNDRCIEIPQKP